MKKKKSLSKNKPPKIDKAAREVIEEFSYKPQSKITTGSLQSSFHKKERRDTRGVYTGTFPIVAVGASAGGVESFSELLSLLPVDTGMSFVLIQHLAPKHESLLPSILSRVCKMAVIRAETDMEARPNHVYVIPPNTNMGIVHGIIKLLPRLEVPGRHMPVDFFFRCLADDQAHLAIGVVLSGADGDGSQGLRAIRAQGGLTIVQDPRTAKVDGMPRTAIAAGGTDTVLPIPEIASELVRLAKHPLSSERSEGIAARDDLASVFQLLRSRTGTNFSKYKDGTILRRLRRRILLHKVDTLAEYVALLKTNQVELDALNADLLINVTSFFRDAEVFDALKTNVLPKLLRAAEGHEPLKIWVPGCATGEEAYSLAMLVTEAMEEANIQRPIQIFASDLSEPSLERAREGVYVESIVMDVTPERLRNFFTKVPGGYRVKPNIRELCIFARHDLTRDPPFSRMEIISCRNLLIYLQTAEQQRVISLFAYSLNAHGYLLLGNSETTSAAEAFDPYDKDKRIYLRKAGVVRAHLDLPTSPAGVKFGHAKIVAKTGEANSDLEGEVNRILIDRFVPVGVVVSATMQIMQFRGSTGAYLEPASGEANLHLLKMAKDGLDTELRILFKKCEKSSTPVRKEGITLRGKGDEFAIEIIPLHLHVDTKYYLVLFDDNKGNSGRPQTSVKSAKSATNRERDVIVGQLKDELVSTREYLQSIIRDQDATNEELQAANEEVLSSNEELQSTNEELETAKEELQSTNEELTTVNDELSQRNSLLAAANSDMNNLLASVNIPIIIVGNDLRIRLFNPMVERVLNVIASDIGRRISDIKPNIDVPDLENLTQETIRSARTMEREVQDKSGHWYSLRIRPYHNVANAVDGAVIILVDIEVPSAGLSVEQAASMANVAVEETIVQPMVFLDSYLRVLSCNRSFSRLFQVDERGLLNLNFFEILDSALSNPALKALMVEVFAKNSSISDFQVDANFPNIGSKKLILSARRIERKTGRELMVIFDDVSPAAR